MAFRQIKTEKRCKRNFCIFSVFVVAAIILSVIIIFSKAPENANCNLNLREILLYVLSGFLGSLLSAYIVCISLRNENKVSKTDAHLRLREMFSTAPRAKIHELLLLYKNLVDIQNQDELGLIEKLELGKVEDVKNAERLEAVKKKIEAELKKDIANLYDYLGIFEIVKDMLCDEILDVELFNKSYQYRLEAIKTAFANIEFLRRQKESEGYWGEVWSLIEKYC